MGCRELQNRKDAPDHRHRKCCSSSALENLALPTWGEGRIYLDVGCGDSPDRLIAAGLGYRAIGLDLFEPKNSEGEFLQADAAEGLPLESASVYAVTSQAMVDLISIAERQGYYSEIFRVLQPAGIFSQIGVRLANGHGFDNREEMILARAAGFRTVVAMTDGFVAVK